jgi:hypothetical protein
MLEPAEKTFTVLVVAIDFSQILPDDKCWEARCSLLYTLVVIILSLNWRNFVETGYAVHELDPDLHDLIACAPESRQQSCRRQRFYHRRDGSLRAFQQG